MTEDLGQERLGTVLADRYRLDSILGRGGAGVVFSATHVLTERQVAVKLVDTRQASEANVTRLMKEARAAVRLEHPNVVEVLDMGQIEDGSVYLALQLLRGKTLAQRLKGRKKLGLDETLLLLEPIMEAVAVAHDAGLIHRDLKPGNIFLHQDGERIVPKLLDFGVVKETDPEAVRTTQVGVVLGTPHFMAPEQARGLPDIGPAVDVWAMGVVLYRTMSGFLPFRGKNLAFVLREITRGEFIPLWEHVPTLPGPIVRVIQTAMTVDREQRFIDMGGFLRALRAAKRGEVLDVPAAAFAPSIDAVDLAAQPLAPIDADEETPLPTGEILEIPEYKAEHTARIRSRRFARPALLVAGLTMILGGAFAAWAIRDMWVAPEVAPLARASELPKKEVPAELPPAAPGEKPEAEPELEAEPESPSVDEQVALLGEAAKALSADVASKVEAAAESAKATAAEKLAVEEEPKVDPAILAAKQEKERATAAAQSARVEALSAREKFGTVRVSLDESQRRADRSLRSTRALTRRAQEPADKRTAQRAREAAEAELKRARAAVTRCEQSRRARVAGRPLDERWRAGDTKLRKGEFASAETEFNDIAALGLSLAADCRTYAEVPAGKVDANPIVASRTSPPPFPASSAEPKPKPQNATAAARAHYERAKKLKGKGNKRGAVKALTEAIKLQPKFVAAYNSRGLLHRDLGNTKGALADFNKANQLDPGNAGILNNRGYAKLAARDLAGAVADFSAAIARDPKNPSFFENRGAARYLRGKFTEAIQDFGRAIELAPASVSAYRQRARTHQKLGDHAGAKSDLDRVIAKRSNDVDALYSRGQSQYELGLHAGAVTDFGKVIKLKPARSEAYLRRGLAYVKTGNKTAAQSDFEQHLKLSPNSQHKNLIKRQLARLR